MPRGSCPLVHRNPNPPLLPLAQPNTHATVAGTRLLPMASMDMADEADIVIAGEADKAVVRAADEAGIVEISIHLVVEACRRLHTLDTRPPDVTALA